MCYSEDTDYYVPRSPNRLRQPYLEDCNAPKNTTIEKTGIVAALAKPGAIVGAVLVYDRLVVWFA